MALDWDAGAGDQAKLQEALSSCLTAIDLNPGYAEAHAYLAEVYADLGQAKQAAESARLAVSLDDSSAFAHRDLGYALEKQNRYNDAVAEYQRAIQLHPGWRSPIDLGRIHGPQPGMNALAAYKGHRRRSNSATPGSLGWACPHR
jgi:tetratricopeptide (TPR) repeat protein